MLTQNSCAKMETPTVIVLAGRALVRLSGHEARSLTIALVAS